MVLNLYGVRIANSYLKRSKEVPVERNIIKMFDPKLSFHVSSLEVEASACVLVFIQHELYYLPLEMLLNKGGYTVQS